jgi:hypothetical protein
MTEPILILLPAWIYWLLAIYMVIDSIRTVVSLFNQYLQYRLSKNF